jgi:hypothetical protein
MFKNGRRGDDSRRFRVLGVLIIAMVQATPRWHFA